jgi:rhodanese-related sulfurtransferase
VSVDALLERARARISRVDPWAADELQQRGGLLIDTRPEALRDRYGTIPGSVHVERNVLEWRLDPTGSHLHPRAVGHRGPIVVFCQEGYASSLAVASLLDVGVVDVHDLDGGFAAWASDGFPITPHTGP